MNEVRAGFAGGGEQRVEMRDVVGDAGKHGRHDESGVDTCIDQFSQGAEPRGGDWRARFELARQARVGRDERQMNLELVALLQPDRKSTRLNSVTIRSRMPSSA